MVNLHREIGEKKPLLRGVLGNTVPTSTGNEVGTFTGMPKTLCQAIR